MQYNICLPEPIRIQISSSSQDLNNFSNKSGIYIFYSKFGKCLYIGKSKDLFSRIKSHLYVKADAEFTNDFNNFLNKFKRNFYYIIDIFEFEEKDLDMFETLLINKLNPYFNVQYNKNKNIIEFKNLFEKIVNDISGENEFYIKRLQDVKNKTE